MVIENVSALRLLLTYVCLFWNFCSSTIEIFLTALLMSSDFIFAKILGNVGEGF